MRYSTYGSDGFYHYSATDESGNLVWSGNGLPKIAKKLTRLTNEALYIKKLPLGCYRSNVNKNCCWINSNNLPKLYLINSYGAECETNRNNLSSPSLNNNKVKNVTIIDYV